MSCEEFTVITKEVNTVPMKETNSETETETETETLLNVDIPVKETNPPPAVATTTFCNRLTTRFDNCSTFFNKKISPGAQKTIKVTILFLTLLALIYLPGIHYINSEPTRFSNFTQNIEKFTTSLYFDYYVELSLVIIAITAFCMIICLFTFPFCMVMYAMGEILQSTRENLSVRH